MAKTLKIASITTFKYLTRLLTLTTANTTIRVRKISCYRVKA